MTISSANAKTGYDQLEYHPGFGSAFRSESVPNSLPKYAHVPEKVPYGLYTEGMTGSAFTAPRASNRRSWLYRIRPSAVHNPYEEYTGNNTLVYNFNQDNTDEVTSTPQQLRWDPLKVKGAENLDFVDSIRTICGAGNAQMKSGTAVHWYQFGKDMDNKAFYSSDGDFLFLPVKGELLIQTEYGRMHVPPCHIAVVQRNMKFTVSRVGDHSPNEPASGYMFEVFNNHFVLPDLGPIGGNGLANIEDFETPTACYEDTDDQWTIVNKYGGKLFQYTQDHSPYDVVSWLGNYVPYRYDLQKFCSVGNISFDHADPSLQCVLQVPSETPGTSIIDFCAFPRRWSAVNDTFRPPWFHRNIVTEFMAAVAGYAAPKDGCNLHNPGTAHGPDAASTEMGYSGKIPDGPIQVGAEGSMICLIETYLPLNPTKWALEESGCLQPNCNDQWLGIKRHHTLPESSYAG
ncbi:hypothetical protein CcaverHIS002_0212060 [Cutaneotrichosporon cavernicola]|uniref:homogentisate 1,2-dioxygenase n=1 Tax=Cutaneotrichosporon cavernicola TaxID=279322 RepID=A0AA48I8M7_9TREE|nr:uncharacterized protein CcaverHIS019_0212070 [Cutaneotrichosporon cavernicola]BEI82046.1 hypothetical protein CcaverHIS002_0212060 [Cutaneotrichosporon cavernicola]BEI89845.1 hypothetical protein CcaverHIS019_0212070 [Cutaneotrichosporon cavernicola]BEI97615.1 hypothetical protein CcaverHIS631_0212040 [Cutaneotrichosporon cavernicola]BEJ05394.1 hypothetical protein CcaverHIS641_0212110 [Cutaneotrichosporon cavernicola]